MDPEIFICILLYTSCCSFLDISNIDFSFPSTYILPEVKVSIFRIPLPNVALPLPDSPTSAKVSPLNISKLILSTATVLVGLPLIPYF